MAVRRALDFYQVIDNPLWQELPPFIDLTIHDQNQVRREVADLLFWLAHAYRFRLIPLEKSSESSSAVAWDMNQRAEACFPQGDLPPAIVLQPGVQKPAPDGY